MNKTKEVFEKIIDNLQTIVNNGEYEKFLKFQKNFRNYSFNNLILIFSQFPDATKVAGKSTWQKLKRTVNKDAKKIWILAPIPQKFNKKVKKVIDGEETEETVIVEYNKYRFVYVYDISQTTGQDLVDEQEPINITDMVSFYDKLKSFSEFPIIEKQLLGSSQGYYSPTNKQIVIKNSLSLNMKVSVLLHELSHALYDDFDYAKERNLSEVFVESIAYIVANHFGLDTSMCSFDYICNWSKGEPNIVINLGNRIQKCANEFIEKLENFETQEEKLVA